MRASESTRWYSLQANLISLAIGYAAVPIGVDAIFSIGPLWSLIAVAMTVGSEGWYYQWRAVEASERLRWRWIVAGNVFSSVVLLLLPPVALAIKEAQPDPEWTLAPYQNALFWGSVIASAALLLGSF